MEQFILEAALEGLEAQKARIEQQIRVAKLWIKGPEIVVRKKAKAGVQAPTPKRGRPAKKTASAKGKRTMSAEGRAKIIAGQKKRWAAFRKAKKKGKK